MFNDMGALGNVTSPGAFRGQAMNHLHRRQPRDTRAGKRTIHWSMHSCPAWCGFVVESTSLVARFSFINKQQFGRPPAEHPGQTRSVTRSSSPRSQISPISDKLLTELQDQDQQRSEHR